MTNQEAIKELSEWLDGCCGGEEIEPTRQALRLAIFALQAQPEIIRCRDCIYSTDYYQDGSCYCKMPSKEMRYIEEGWDFYCAAGKEKSDEKNLGESRNES